MPAGTSLANAAMLQNLALLGFDVLDGLDAGGFTTTSGNTTQAKAVPVSAPVNRFITSKSAGTGTVILKSLLTGEAQSIVFIINDSPYTIVVYPASGEYLNGSQNGTQSVAAGYSLICVPCTPSIAQQYAATGPLADVGWRVNTIS